MTQDINRTEAIVLPATLRSQVGKQSASVRREEKLPAVLYGHGIKNVNLTVDYRIFQKVYRQAGGSRLVDLQVGGAKPVKVLVQHVQKHPVSDLFMHVDFHQVRMTEKISAAIALNFIGTSKAVKETGGILVKNLTECKVECLPQDLVQAIDVPIDALNTFDDNIRIRDLVVPPGIMVKEKEDEVVVSVQPPRSEEELKSLEEKPEEKVDEVVVAGKEKKDEEAATADAAEPAADKSTKKDKK
ncbi:MAG: 50S ribosomal protein L25 [Patescibacteria group bacterium]